MLVVVCWLGSWGLVCLFSSNDGVVFRGMSVCVFTRSLSNLCLSVLIVITLADWAWLLCMIVGTITVSDYLFGSVFVT